MDATTTQNEGGATAPPAATNSAGGSAAQQKEPKLPSLTGNFVFIKELCESQRPSLGKKMADHSIAMFKIRVEILRRLDSLKRFDTTYVDKHDVDTDGNGKVKPFIPGSLRNPQPLNFSKEVKKDSRCAETLTALTTVIEEAATLHTKYQEDMSAKAKRIAELEIKGRKLLLLIEFLACLIDIGAGLFAVAKYSNDDTIFNSPTLDNMQVAHAAINTLFTNLPTKVWESLPFMVTAEPAAITECYELFQKDTGINYARDIHLKITPSDSPLIEWVATTLQSHIVKLTTDLWDNYDKKGDIKSLDADLAELYDKMAVDEANDALSSRMDTDDSREAIVEICNEQIKANETRRVAKQKQTARKNSSDGPKNQGSKSTSNGKGKGKKSKENQEKEEKDYSDQPSRNSRGRDYYPPSNRRRYNDHYNPDYHRDSRYREEREEEEGESRRPRSILRGSSRERHRRRSVSWGRSASPHRHRDRYSHRSDQHHEGTSYHQSRRTSYNPNYQGRGRGRGRGRSSRGGRGGSRSGGRGRS